MEELKEELLELYNELVDDFFHGMHDEMDMSSALKNNFKLKLEEYETRIKEQAI